MSYEVNLWVASSKCWQLWIYLLVETILQSKPSTNSENFMDILPIQSMKISNKKAVYNMSIFIL